MAALVEAEAEEAGKRSKSEGKRPPPPRPALSAALARAICVAAASDGPTAGEAEILSAEPSEGAELESAVPSSSSKAGAAAAAAEGAGAGRRERPRPRVLVLAATPASGAAYIPLMNCVFAAQRLAVTVDVCELVEGAAGGAAQRGATGKSKTSGAGAGAGAAAATAGGAAGGWANAAAEEEGAIPGKQQPAAATSTLLSQAAHLTGGVVVSPFALSGPSDSSAAAPSNPAACLLQTLMAVFAPSGRVRRWLSLPQTGTVDMRASCFCHKVREGEREREGGGKRERDLVFVFLFLLPLRLGLLKGKTPPKQKNTAPHRRRLRLFCLSVYLLRDQGDVLDVWS